MGKVTEDEKKVLTEALDNVKKHLRITKVVCTRSVKGRGGDHYVGFSAAWDTIQDDSGGGADLNSAQDGDTDLAAHGGMTLKEGRVAALVLAMQADLAAHDHAAAGSNISSDQREVAQRAIKSNYTKLMIEALRNGNGNGEG